MNVRESSSTFKTKHKQRNQAASSNVKAGKPSSLEASLQLILQTMKGMKAEFSTQLGDLRSDVKAVDAKVEALDARVKALDAKVETLDAKVEDLSTRVLLLEQKDSI